MAKLYFKYGATGASKSSIALQAKFNYEEKGQRVLLLKPRTGDDDIKMVQSRIGLTAPCHWVSEVIDADSNIISEQFDGITVVIVDDAQFLSKDQVDALSVVVDDLEIPVMCFGLRTDFKGKFFEGSKRLMEIADEITELKTMCWCGRKATFTARYDDNGMIVDGEQMLSNSNIRYTAVCRKHYFAGKLTQYM